MTSRIDFTGKGNRPSKVGESFRHHDEQMVLVEENARRGQLRQEIVAGAEARRALKMIAA